MWSVLLCLPAVLALACVTTGHAQDRSVVTEEPVLAPVRSQLEATLASARREGLPSEWIALKIREGLAKHVPPARIAAAANTMLVRLRDAAAIERVVPAARAAGDRLAILRAVTDALTAGAPPGELGELVRSVAAAEPVRARSVALRGLAVVAELGERGFQGTDASRAVRTAYRRGGSAAWGTLLTQAASIHGSDASARGRALISAATAGSGPEDHGRSDQERGRPGQEHGAPHDDAFDQGRGRGRGRGR